MIGKQEELNVMVNLARYKNHKINFCTCCICKAKRGEFKVSDKIRKQISKKLKGKKKPIGFGKKLSLMFKGHKVSKETRLKISKKLLGHKRPQIEKEKIRNTIKKLYIEGKWKIPNLKGKNHPHWIKDRTLLEYDGKFTKELKEQIRKRDNFKCQKCGFKQNEKRLDVHHIDYNKKNNDTKNLISLCGSCHRKTNYKRDNWKNYFERIKSKCDNGECHL